MLRDMDHANAPEKLVALPVLGRWDHMASQKARPYSWNLVL